MAFLDDRMIRVALAELGRRLGLDRDVEILLVGGAAGVLIGELPPAWTTEDVDMIHCQLPQDRDAVLSAAAEVGRRLPLSPGWFSEDVGLYEWTLPPNWEARRVPVGAFGHLHVYSVSRLDLIAMKFISHRERDLEHLMQMNVSAAEREFVLHYLDSLAQDHPDEFGRIEMARRYAEAWEVHS